MSTLIPYPPPQPPSPPTETQENTNANDHPDSVKIGDELGTNRGQTGDKPGTNRGPLEDHQVALVRAMGDF